MLTWLQNMAICRFVDYLYYGLCVCLTQVGVTDECLTIKSLCFYLATDVIYIGVAVNARMVF